METQPELEDLLQRGYRFAFSLTHDREEAEDLLQDAWLAVLKRRGPRHVGYLFQTIRNRFVDQARRRRLIVLEPLGTEEEERGGLGFLDEAEVRVDMATLDQALGILRPEERETLFLAAVEGFTLREIAELTRRPLGTVSSLVQRARRKLVSFVGRQGKASS